MARLIQARKSVIPACDVADLKKLGQIIAATATVPGIGGYKVGLELVIPYGLREVVEVVKTVGLPVIYDHQKGGTDIPELGAKFAKAVKNSGADAVILFPFGGAATERDWIRACFEAGLTVIVGGHMTQRAFLESEGGFIADRAVYYIYELAVIEGVRDFVVPGNKVDAVERYRLLLENLLEEEEFRLYAPGFISQGGSISETGRVAGNNWHAIVGSAIYNHDGAEAMRSAALEMTSRITGT
jgi:orotidine-5'-phosphate decarboxylase